VEMEELGLEGLDELVHTGGPLRYDFVAERHARGVLLQGRLAWLLRCECARCLKAFDLELVLDPWSCLLLWEGEEAVKVHNDCVDLTPYLREDMVLKLPQRPLCTTDCAGLTGRETTSALSPDATQSRYSPASAWQELDKLNF